MPKQTDSNRHGDSPGKFLDEMELCFFGSVV